MKANLVAFVMIATVIVSPGMANPEVAPTATVWQEGQRDTAPGTGAEFWIVGNAKFVTIQSHARRIAVFMQPQRFTIESLRSVFLQLSAEYPEEDLLFIDALSNDSQVEVAKSWFAEIQSFPFGNVPPRPRCASPPDPLTATYWRADLSESFTLYPASLDGEPISVQLQGWPDDCSPSGDTATDLVIASRRGCEEVVQELLAGGADPNVKSQHGGAALVEASLWGPENVEIVRLLLEAGANVNQISSSGWTALIAATLGNRPNIIDLLLTRGADVNHRSQEGRTALMYAVLWGKKAVIKKLLAHGADVNVEDGYGKTVLMIAEETHSENLIRLLRKAGASR